MGYANGVEFSSMIVIAMAIALTTGGGGYLDQGAGCIPVPPVPATGLTISTPDRTQLDPADAVLSVHVPLLTMPIRAFIGGPGLRWESGVLMPLPATPGKQAVSGNDERRGVQLPPLRPGTRYNVALVYVQTPDGCLPPRPTLIGSFTTP